MKIASVIAEFNPLHNAHKYILEQTKQYGCDATVVVLGGNFMQRGEASVLDFYDRAVSAVKCGADLVLLLPYVYSAQTAEVFAWGGVCIAEGIGTDTLFFGSEDSKLDFFSVAKLLTEEPAEFVSLLKSGLDCGLSFAVAREDAVRKLLGDDAAKCLRGANNILSTEYTKAVIRCNFSIKTKSIKRISSALSATKIRQMLYSGDINSVKEYVPEESFGIISGGRLHFTEEFENLLFDALLLKGEKELAGIAEVENGLERRMYVNRYMLSEGMESYAGAVSTKRYTKSRIRRILFNNAVGYTKDDMDFYRSYAPKSALALAANGKGREIIKNINSERNFRIISNLRKDSEIPSADRPIYDIECHAYEIYHRKKGTDLSKKHCVIL